MRNNAAYMAFALAASLLSACGDKDHLSESKMTDVMVDMALADGYSKTNAAYASDSAKNVMRLSILRKHGITQEELDRSLEWYGHNLDKFSSLNEQIEKEISKRESRYLASSDCNVDAKESSIWPYSPMAMLSPYGNTDALMFSIPTSEFDKGERFSWSMRLSSNTPVQLVLGVDYKEGGTSYVSRRFNMNPKLQIELLTDSAKNISRIYGYMSVDNFSSLPVWTDSIMLRHTPFSPDAYMTYQQQTMYDGPRKQRQSNTASLMGSGPVGRESSNVIVNPGRPADNDVPPQLNEGESMSRPAPARPAARPGQSSRPGQLAPRPAPGSGAKFDIKKTR